MTPRQFRPPPVLTVLGNNSLSCCCCWALTKMSWTLATSFVRNSMSASFRTGFCWSHSMQSCRVQLLGRGTGNTLNSVARRATSLQKSVFLGCNDADAVLESCDHGSDSRQNRGTFPVRPHKPIHIRYNTFFWLPASSYSFWHWHNSASSVTGGASTSILVTALSSSKKLMVFKEAHGGVSAEYSATSNDNLCEIFFVSCSSRTKNTCSLHTYALKPMVSIKQVMKLGRQLG